MSEDVLNKMSTLDVKDRFLVIHSDELSVDNVQLLQKKVLEKGGLGVITLDEGSEVFTLDPKNQVIILKTDHNFNPSSITSIKEQMQEYGALGMVQMGKDDEVQSIGVEELEKIVQHMKKAKYADSGSN